MSPPDTDIEKQERRHRPALWGIAIAIILGFVFFASRTMLTVENADTDEQTDDSGVTAPASEAEGY